MRTTDGECCIFPFTFEGRQYYSCTTVDNKNTPWCYYKLGLIKKWGYCKEGKRSWVQLVSTALKLEKNALYIKILLCGMQITSGSFCSL